MKIYIQKSGFIGGDPVKIFAIEESGGSRDAIGYDSKEKLLILTRLEKNSANIVEPFLELPSDFFEDLVKAVLVYANENNIKAESETLIQGKLIATEKHLDHSNMNLDKLIDFIVKTKK